MSIQEFLLKTCLIIVLPGVILYGCLRENEAFVIEQKAHRTCLNSLHGSSVTMMTIVGQADDGHLVYQHIVDASALQQLRVLAKGLRPVRVQAGGYRPSLRRYSLQVANGRDTCKLVVYKMPPGTADLLDGVGDSAYEAPRFIPFLDSLFRLQSPAITRQWLSK
ncbi:hypothetical protein [Hymenobacter canadensis]|uniref:Lipoprotein n=1 Tax=Hymenobacter canadensis TaxID=2999067 RepID=A0ABY7LRH6_9BACT|nr:hypothetical protein [Hymenobacter canadensis]WBA43022.1 hypothetical protein O3303_05515 [Hymenobacter canadensis]